MLELTLHCRPPTLPGPVPSSSPTRESPAPYTSKNVCIVDYRSEPILHVKDDVPQSPPSLFAFSPFYSRPRRHWNSHGRPAKPGPVAVGVSPAGSRSEALPSVLRAGGARPRQGRQRGRAGTGRGGGSASGPAARGAMRSGDGRRRWGARGGCGGGPGALREQRGCGGGGGRGRR